MTSVRSSKMFVWPLGNFTTRSNHYLWLLGGNHSPLPPAPKSVVCMTLTLASHCVSLSIASTWVVAHWRRNIIHPNVISRRSHHVQDALLRRPYQIFQYRSYSDDELLISHVNWTSNATPIPPVDYYDAVSSWQHVPSRDKSWTELMDFFLSFLPDIGSRRPWNAASESYTRGSSTPNLILFLLGHLAYPSGYSGYIQYLFTIKTIYFIT